MGDSQFQYPPSFDALGEQIEACRDRARRLKELEQAMIQSDAFSPEEITAVNTASSEAEAESNSLADELADAMRIWRDDIVTVQRRLHARAEVVKNFETDLARHGPALECIARGQVHLQQQATASAQAIGCGVDVLAFSGDKTETDKGLKSASETPSPVDATGPEGTNLPHPELSAEAALPSKFGPEGRDDELLRSSTVQHTAQQSSDCAHTGPSAQPNTREGQSAPESAPESTPEPEPASDPH